LFLLPLGLDWKSLILAILVGAALWAADIEKKENEMARSTAPGLLETAKKAE